MNEASSKFVDQLAVDKLLEEKLNKVHHFTNIDLINNDIKNLDLNNSFNHDYSEIMINKRTAITFESIVKTHYDENNISYAFYFPVKTSYVNGTIIFVHGLYENNLDIYNFFISLLNNSGLNVYIFILPFHYLRKPKESIFSGEYFWSGKIERNILAFKQSLFDLYKLYSIIKSKTKKRVILTGFSMGGGISLLFASLIKLDGIFVINPISNISELVWKSKLFSTVKNDFEKSGLDLKFLKSCFRNFDPIQSEDFKTKFNNVAIGISLYDQINDIKNYNELINQLPFSKIFKYKAGHLNILRVPKLANDIYQTFFNDL